MAANTNPHWAINPVLFNQLPKLLAFFDSNPDPSLRLVNEPVEARPVTVPDSHISPLAIAPPIPPPSPLSNNTVAVGDIPVPSYPVVIARHAADAPEPIAGECSL
ncbi:hypothetical protein PPACK8108_LOCUS22781 [Phakopsora pachyrhizi]|uniref:Uncharacterized protein n=1 Tax=Phakopsora pachyrhizi TaxID=170000 RepID=A0AAV0BL13_PHAPC|nr:hypothetical protein PPACK8108_LOCUS22781 [Phakopsora pachyrhizi]